MGRGEGTMMSEPTDTELFDFAEANPEAAMKKIHAYWANCGPGWREDFFNFRGAFKAAMEDSPDAGD